jgi:polar amino acid transport system substrate-binding protein
VDFSPAVVQFDYTYLVPADSTIRSAADADRPGIRVVVVNKHASTLTLSRVIKHAELIGADVPDAAFELLRTGKAHAFASAREPLEDYAAKLPGSRVLTDAYGVNRVGIAIQQGHPGRLTYISEFVEEAKASGLVQRAIDRAGLAQLRGAPSARTN